MIYLRLLYEYFKIGLFSIGGGMATIPFLYDQADRTGWFTHAQLADMIAVSESTPGPIGINMATYVGYVVKGIPGALIAVFGLVLPSVIIIVIIARMLQAFRHNRFVEAAFYGIRPASTGLIAAAGYTIIKLALLNLDAFAAQRTLSSLFHIKALILALVVLILSNWVPATRKLHPIVFILLSAVVGVVFQLGS